MCVCSQDTAFRTELRRVIGLEVTLGDTSDNFKGSLGVIGVLCAFASVGELIFVNVKPLEVTQL